MSVGVPLKCDICGHGAYERIIRISMQCSEDGVFIKTMRHHACAAEHKSDDELTYEIEEGA